MAKRKTKGTNAEALPTVIAAKIQGLLQTATVANGEADFQRDLFDEFIRFLGAHSPWKDCLRDLDCWLIAYRWLYSVVDIPKEANGLLKDCLPPEKLMAMHDEIVAELLSYPRKYSVCFELPALKDHASLQTSLTCPEKAQSSSEVDGRSAAKVYSLLS